MKIQPALSRRSFSASLAGLSFAVAGLAACKHESSANSEDARAAADVLTAEQLAFSEGNIDAPVIMQEFLSLTCPHCAIFHVQQYPAIKEQYVDTGKLLVVYRDFPLDGMALRAHMLVRSLPPALGIKLQDVLLRQQSNWINREGNLQPLIDLARLAGMTPDQVQAVFEDEALMDQIISERQSATTEYGIGGTPGFVIGNQRYDSGSHGDLTDWIASYIS